MILIFLLNISSIFANKGNDGNSTVRESRNLLKISDKTRQVNLYGQPRFNTSCDLESLEAAYECEVRVYCLFRNFSCKNLNTMKILYFLSKLMFS